MRRIVETVLHDVELPLAGEVWLFVQTGLLYEMRARDKAQNYRSCHRIGAPEMDYGCDPGVFLACWDHKVREGDWVRLYNCPPTPEVDCESVAFTST